MITNLQNKEALLNRLLDSPLAAEFERSLSLGVEAARRRAARALQDLKAKHEPRYASLTAASRELVAKRDALAREYKQVKIAAARAGDSAQMEREAFAQRCAQVRSLSTASAYYLRENGLDSAEAIERHLGIGPTND